MSFADNLTLLGCAGVLSLALLVALRGGRTPLALPIALPLVLLSIDVFLWNFTALAYRSTHVAGWHWAQAGVWPLVAPLTMHFLLAFTGRIRPWRAVVVFCYVAFGVLGLISSGGAFSDRIAEITETVWWRDGTLACAVAVAITGLLALIAHLREASDPTELDRTRLFLVAFGVAGFLVGVDVLFPGGLLGLPLGRLGVLIGVSMAAFVTLRVGLFERDLRTSAAAEAVALVAVASVGYFVAFRLLGESNSLFTLALAFLTLALFAGLRYAFGSYAAHRERIERLSTLGTFSAQLAHDLKNPLAALKGAAQFLREEWVRGNRGDPLGEYFDLIVEQADRLGRVLDRYQRLGGLNPRREALDLNALVKNALVLQRFAAGQAIEVKAVLDEALPPCLADKDLIGVALDNLLRNAAEAMPQSGRLTVRTTRSHTPQGDEVLLSVEDTGMGMSPRTRERAFDGFFTTKPQGSGLGLAFVRKVAEAHGGSVSLTSEVGRGTVVRLSLPPGERAHG